LLSIEHSLTAGVIGRPVGALMTEARRAQDRDPKIRQLTDVSHCKLQHTFLSNRQKRYQCLLRSAARAAARKDQCPAGPAQHRTLGSPMNAMAPTRPTELRRRQVPLPAGPAAAAQARSQVRAAIFSWDIPVDPCIAVLLASELVTNAIRHETGRTVVLTIACSGGQLRVEVHDTSRSLPVVVDASADAETGRGLLLVATLSTDWGSYRTSAGKAVFFTLACRPGRGEAGDRGPQQVRDVGTAIRNP
jgi:anti-sigma regulatory factor (Ser/Thr protein kinase)